MPNYPRLCINTETECRWFPNTWYSRSESECVKILETINNTPYIAMRIVTTTNSKWLECRNRHWVNSGWIRVGFEYSTVFTDWEIFSDSIEHICIKLGIYIPQRYVVGA